jgi:hypothetical protein
MRITKNPVLDMETLQWISNDGTYEYSAPVELFCSSGSKAVEANDLKLQNSQIAMNAQLSSDYGMAFANNQSVLGQQRARLSYMSSNPLGYSPQQLALAKTSINENTSRAASEAIGKAAAYGASHSVGDTSGGGAGAMVGQIASEAAQAKATDLSQLSSANEELKQQNMWKALSGLQDVGSAYGTSSRTAITGATNSANSATGAGSGAVDAEKAASQEFGGVLGSIGGLVSAGTGFVGMNPNGIFGK